MIWWSCCKLHVLKVACQLIRICQFVCMKMAGFTPLIARNLAGFVCGAQKRRRQPSADSLETRVLTSNYMVGGRHTTPQKQKVPSLSCWDFYWIKWYHPSFVLVLNLLKVWKHCLTFMWYKLQLNFLNFIPTILKIFLLHFNQLFQKISFLL